MSVHTNINGVWRDTQTVSSNINSTWRSSATGNVNISGVYRPFLLTAKPVLDDNTWDEIKAVSDAGLGANYWSIGEGKQFTSDSVYFSYGTRYAYIIGFNHNASLEGNNHIHFQLARATQLYSASQALTFINTENHGTVHYMSDSTPTIANAYVMNTAYSASNTVGWARCSIRAYWNNTDLFNKIIAGVSNIESLIKPVIKYTDNVGGSSNSPANMSATSDYFFLLSEYEVFGNRTNANSAEQNYQQQYAYYASGSSRIKYSQGAGVLGTAKIWWLRSPSAANSVSYCTVSTTGAIGTANPRYFYGVSPCFCI